MEVGARFSNTLLIYYKKFNKNIRYKPKLLGKINNGLNGTKTKFLRFYCRERIEAMTDE